MNFNFKHIAPTDLRNFAKSLGWQQLKQAIVDNLYVLNNPEIPRRQLIFPLNSDAPDYSDSVELVLNKLSEIQNKPLSVIISSLNELKDDTLRFRIVDGRNEDSFIPLSYAANAINGAKEMFLSAACTVLKPQVFHPRLSRTEAQELVEKSRFRHTEGGSFILKVSTPVNAMELQGNLFQEENLSFVRQTTLTINNGLNKLVTAIETDTLTQLVDEIKNDPKPNISSNLCKSVINFQEDHNDYDLYVDFTWAGLSPVPINVPIKKVIKIQKDYFPRIDEVKKELRRTTLQNEDIFMASVERLDGELGYDGKRSGEVIFNLYQEGEIIRAKTNLDINQYEQADKAHMTA
ncbi:MAG: hypothetical protein EOP45_12715, partial [Sphingobacteriaceae bacterium]